MLTISSKVSLYGLGFLNALISFDVKVSLYELFWYDSKPRCVSQLSEMTKGVSLYELSEMCFSTWFYFFSH